MWVQEVRAALSKIILTVMAKVPSLRYQTADEFRQRLDRLSGAPQPAGESAQRAAPIAESDVTMMPTARVAGRKLTVQWSSWRLWAAGFFTFMVVVLTVLAITRRL